MMFQHLIDSLKDAFRSVSAQQENHVPEKGMQWHIRQHRRYAHYARGYNEFIGMVQIVAVDDEAVEYLHNSYLYKVSHEEWQDFYEEKLRRARPATNSPGKGSYIPFYQGIQPVHESYVEMQRNPRPLRLVY